MASIPLPANPFGFPVPGLTSPQSKEGSAAKLEALQRINAMKEAMRAKNQADRKAPFIAGAAAAAASFERMASLPSKSPSITAQSDAQAFADTIDVEEGKKKVSGRVQSVKFERDGFYFLKVLPHGKHSRTDEILIKGNGIELKPGCDIVAVGIPRSETSEQYGPQNILDKSIVFEVVPTTIQGIYDLLRKGYVKGLGQDTARLLCNAFGERLFDMAEDDKAVELLLKLQGVRVNEVTALIQTVRAKKELPRLMTYLAEVGLNVQTASAVLKKLGPGAIGMIKKNPYELMGVPSIGFSKADEIARARGVLFDSDLRIAASLEACLENLLKKGSTFMRVTDAKVAMGALLEVDDSSGQGAHKLNVDFCRIDQVCEHELIHSGRVMLRHHMVDEHAPHLQSGDDFMAANTQSVTERIVSLTQDAGRERRIAKQLALCVASGVTPASLGAKPSGTQFTKLSHEQQCAVRTTLGVPVSVITGRPGCGKTTTTKALVDAMVAAGLRVLMVAPTNRAAKQMSDATGLRAKTIHSALGCRGFDVYTYGPKNLLPYDVVIADEQSMVDAEMMDKLLGAIRPKTSLVIIGDKEQLASINAGNVLSDIIKSGVIPVSYLTEIRRTGKDSSINPNAHRVADRLAPIAPKPGENDDFCMREVRSAWHGASDKAKDQAERSQIQAVIEQFNHYRAIGHKPEDIQILTPMRHKSRLGANELNIVMKNLLNPVRNPDDSVTLRSTFEPRTYSVGDRVMYTANDQVRDIYNGDIGYILGIDQQTKTLLVDFEDNSVEMAFAELSDLDHAYVNTVHKTQGGEYPAVIFIAVNAHYNMLDRQGIYTGMTRGKKNVCLLGDTHRLQTFVEKSGSEMRKTMLDDEIVKAFGALNLINFHFYVPDASTASRRLSPL